MTVYLTTVLETQNPYLLNSAANKALTPVRYFFGGKCVQVLDNSAISFTLPEFERSYLKTAAMIACFIPGLIFGTLARTLSYAIEEVRRGFTLMQNPPPVEPAPIAPKPTKDLLPIESLVDKNIAFFKELLATPDLKLKAWLDEKKNDPAYTDPFYGTSVIEESKMSFEDIDAERLTNLADLFKMVVERLQRLGLESSVSASIMTKTAQSAATKAQGAPAKPVSLPQVPSILNKGLLDIFRKAKSSMTDVEFEKVCKQFNQDPKIVITKLKEQDDQKQEALRANNALRAVEASIAFFLELRDEVADKDVANWIKNKKTTQGYPYPFFVGANKAGYAKYLKKIEKNDLAQHYTTTVQRLTKLNLEEFLNEQHPLANAKK